MRPIPFFIFTVLFILAFCGLIHSTIKPRYAIGCVFRTPFTGKPTGATAKDRYAGYLEAMEVLAHSDLPPEILGPALETLSESDQIDKYIVGRP